MRFIHLQDNMLLPLNQMDLSPLRDELKITMKELIERTEREKKMIYQMKQWLIMIPGCLLDLIYEYQFIKDS